MTSRLSFAEKRRFYLALIVILWAAFAVRLWHLGTQSLWHDEAWSVFSAYAPLAVTAPHDDPNAPPIFYMLLGGWLRIMGDSVWAMRYLSLLIGVPFVAITATVTRRLVGQSAALLAALLVALSPLLWVYSQEIRAYIAMPLFALLLLMLAEQLLRKPSRRAWLWLLLIELITLYTHNLAVPIVAWLNLSVIAVWLWRRDVRQIGSWLVTQIVIALAYVPWLITQRPTGTALNTPPAPDPAILWTIWQTYFAGVKPLIGTDGLLTVLSGGLGIVAVLALIALILKRRSLQMWLILSQAILLPIFELAIIWAAHIDFHPRYFVAGTAAALIAIAAGVQMLPRTARRIGVIGVALFGIAIAGRALPITASSPIYQHDDFRALAEHYAALNADDAILIPYGWEPTLAYYAQKMNFKARLITIPLHSSADSIIAQLQAELPTVHHLELLTWYQLPADLRGAYPCLLGAMGHAMGDSLTVEGLHSEGYTGFDVSAPQTLQTDGGFTGGPFAVLRDRYFWSGHNLCVLSRWRVTQPTAEHWRFVLRVRLGWETYQADSELRNDDQLPPANWKGGDTVTVFSAIQVPSGVPVSAYKLDATLYSPQTPQGLTVGTTGSTIDFGRAAPIHSCNAELSAIAPTAQDILIAPDMYLHGKQIPMGGVIRQGQTLPVRLEWLYTRACELMPPDNLGGALVLQGDGWQQSVPLTVGSTWPTELFWHIFRVPASAVGKATLSIVLDTGKTIALADDTINEIKRTFATPTEPPDRLMDAAFNGVGKLIAFDAPLTLKSGAAFPIMLMWQATNTPTADHTVFVHLLDANGQVIAQNDAPPVNGDRPTTSWLIGEYISDLHTLTFNQPDYHGPATLEVGLYDPSTGARVLLSNGANHVALPVTIAVQ